MDFKFGARLICRKAFKVNGHSFQPGEDFTYTQLGVSSRKAIQLINNRLVIPASELSLDDIKQLKAGRRIEEDPTKAEDCDYDEEAATDPEEDPLVEVVKDPDRPGYYHVYKDGVKQTDTSVKKAKANRIAEGLEE